MPEPTTSLNPALAERVLIDRDPFVSRSDSWHDPQHWPAKWVRCATAGDTPHVCTYRLALSVDGPTTLRVHVSADERYALYLDGQRIGRGPERGDADHWFFETYDLHLGGGDHTLIAVVWALGDGAPFAQHTVQPGFVLAADDEAWHDRLNTGSAPWRVRPIEGISFERFGPAFGVGPQQVTDATALPGDAPHDAGDDGWADATPARVATGGEMYHGYGEGGRWLRPARLGAMTGTPLPGATVRHADTIDADAESHVQPIAEANHLPDVAAAWQAMLDGKGAVAVPAGVRRRVLIDLNDYACAYPKLTATGAGATVRMSWAEGLFERRGGGDDARFIKGDRDTIEGMHVVGFTDTFVLTGEPRAFDTLWWRPGRYVLIDVTTTGEPATIDAIAFEPTHYPLTHEGRFACSDARWAELVPILVRSMQMCSHETYFDCPYYEQLMYVGDTRLEVLTQYVMTTDDRLPRKAVDLFAWSRQATGLTASRHPSRRRQIIPPFSLWWVGMVYDAALWRGDRAFVDRQMPVVRSVLDAFAGFTNADGLVENPPGWNFVDWCWQAEPGRGVPWGGNGGVSGPINWQYVLALTYAAELEHWLGRHDLAERHHHVAAAVADAITGATFDAARGLLADDVTREHFSEHSQCLAILSGLVDDGVRRRIAAGLLNDDTLTRCTIYFSHYLLETFGALGEEAALFARLEEWHDLPGQGFKTTRETPEPSRSDCHAWGAHPLYQAMTTVLGLRPDGLGFDRIAVEPMLGELTSAEGVLPTPHGDVVARYRRDGDRLTGSITLPGELTGELTWRGQTYKLTPGQTPIDVA